jgi:hypothetical protein
VVEHRARANQLGPFEEEDVPVDIGSTVPSDLKDEFDIECSDTVQKPARPPDELDVGAENPQGEHEDVRDR